MGRNSAIEWTTHTFNPWIGCTRISPACDHCYAADWDKRFHSGEHWGAGAPRRRTSKSNWRQPYKWARQARETGERPRVFCCSLADVFDNEVPAEWREDLWQVIRDTPELDWLLLTKRIGNVRQMLPGDWGDGWPHVWLGITVVTQDEADRDVPKLLRIPAAVRWLSMEPLLEPVSVAKFLDPWTCPDCEFLGTIDDAVDSGDDHEPIDMCPECGGPRYAPDMGFMFLRSFTGGCNHDGYGLDWIVSGGESGPHARPMHPDWPRSLREQCAAAGVPFLFKQWGEWAPFEWGAKTGIRHPQDEQCMSANGYHVYAQVGHAAGLRQPDDVLMARVGKKRAGRLLDGREHNKIPARRSG